MVTTMNICWKRKNYIKRYNRVGENGVGAYAW